MTPRVAPRRWRACLTLTVLLLAAWMPDWAAAQDWSLRARVGQTLSFETNRTLEDDAEPSFGSTTALSINGIYETERARWDLGSNLRFRFFTNDDDVDVFSPNVRLNGRYALTSTASVTPFLRFRRNNQSFNALLFIEDPGDPTAGIGGDGDGGTGGATSVITDADATRTDIDFGSGLTFGLTPRTQLGFDASGSLRRFSDDAETLENSTAARFQTTVTQRLTQRTALNFGSGVTLISIDDAESTSAFAFTNTVGVERQVSERLAIAASGGATFTRRTEDDLATGGSETETAITGSGGLSLDYREGDTRFSLNVSQAVEPGDEGDVDVFTRLRLGFSQPLTLRNTISVTGAVARSTSAFEDGGEDTDVVASISPQLSWRINQDWRANLRYTFEVGTDDDSTNISNGVFVSVSRPLVLY